MIAPIGLAARLLLAFVFAVAGTAKLRDRSGTRSTLEAFGTPARMIPAFAIALPLAELAVAALLLPASTSLYGALGALVLLTLFSVAIAWNLAHGRAPDCHCFGQLHSAPASRRTLARNVVLMGVAGVALTAALIEPPASALGWIGRFDGAEVVALAVAIVALAALTLGGAALVSLLRSYGRVLTRLEGVEAALVRAGVELDDELAMPEIGLEPGTPAPAFTARSVDGDDVSLETLTTSGLPTLLLFTSPHCGPCSALMPTVAEWQREHTDALSIVLASSGEPDEIRAEADEHGLTNVLLDSESELYRLFEANGTPSAVLVGRDGEISSWVASGREWIEELVEQALGGHPSEVLPVGTEAPALELSSLSGATVSLDSLRGRDTLFLFWNPSCGFCRTMHEDLLAWEASANGVHPRLVVVSSGDAVGTRAEGFASLVLLDESFETSRAFGADGTPMAVLIDAEGRIASRVVAGADAVLELANARVPA